MFEFKGEQYRTVPANLSYAFMKLARASRTIERTTGSARNAAVAELLTLQLDTLERVIHPEDLPALEAALDESTFQEIESAINRLVAHGAGQGNDQDESVPSSESGPQTRSASATGSSRPAAKARAKKSS